MYLSRMKRRIMQLSICLDHETMANYLVLIETTDNLPQGTYIVKLPDSFNFYNEKTPYYVINQN